VTRSRSRSLPVITQVTSKNTQSTVKVKVVENQGNLEEIAPKPRSAAERKASFKSSARRRIYQQRIPEEEIIGGNDNQHQTSFGRFEQDGGCGGGEMLGSEQVLPGPAGGETRSVAVDDIGLTSRRADDDDAYDDVTVTSQDLCRVYRMRSFYTKSGNIVNRGDSMRMRTPPTAGGIRRARGPAARDVTATTGSSNGSGSHVVNDGASPKLCVELAADNDVTADAHIACRDMSRDHLTVGHAFTSGTSRCQRVNSGNESMEDVAASAYRVLVLGTHGVGKTKLIEQLMTSEYLANKESFAGTCKFVIAYVL